MMAPGKYLIVASRYWKIRARHHPISMLYYPARQIVRRGEVVTINAGSHIEGIDLRVPAIEK
jgi:hypothetical protein